MSPESIGALAVLLLQQALGLLTTAGDAHQTDENKPGMLYNAGLNLE